MSRNPRQAAQLLGGLIRMFGGRLSPLGLVVVLLVAVGWLVAQPYIERQFGVRLPSILAESESPGDLEEQTKEAPQRSTRSSQPGSDQQVDVLTDVGSGVLESPAGLRYTRGSQHGHRLKHLLAHGRDDPNRPHKHGVFDEQEPNQLVALVDEAYQMAEAGRASRSRREGERDIHVVNFGRRIGYIGGQWGASRGKPAAKHLQLVLQGRNVITAYPVIP